MPRLLSTIRQETFRKYAWPGVFAGLFTRNGLLLLASAVFVPALLLLAVVVLAEPGALFTPHSDQEGAFYRVVPYRVMAGVFGALAIADLPCRSSSDSCDSGVISVSDRPRC